MYLTAVVLVGVLLVCLCCGKDVETMANQIPQNVLDALQALEDSAVLAGQAEVDVEVAQTEVNDAQTTLNENTAAKVEAVKDLDAKRQALVDLVSQVFPDPAPKA